MITINENESFEWSENLTVENLLNALNYNYSFLIVTVNGKVIKKEAFSTFFIEENADIRITKISPGG